MIYYVIELPHFIRVAIPWLINLCTRGLLSTGSYTAVIIRSNYYTTCVHNIQEYFISEFYFILFILEAYLTNSTVRYSVNFDFIRDLKINRVFE